MDPGECKKHFIRITCKIVIKQAMADNNLKSGTIAHAPISKKHILNVSN